MASGLSVPDHIRYISGGMVKCCDTNTRIMRCCQKCEAGAEAGAYDTQLLISLLFQPIETAADVNHTLASGIKGTPDVGGDRIVCAADFCRHADIVVGHG